MSINQKGRREYIFVDLEAIYHSPDILGSELSLEELRAGHRGWLSKVWESEIPKRQQAIEPSIAVDPVEQAVEAITREVSEKLVIARDPVALNENGVQKEGRGRRMKIKEVNETQISKFNFRLWGRMLTHQSQSEIVISFGTKDDQAEIIQGADNDDPH